MIVPYVGQCTMAVNGCHLLNVHSYHLILVMLKIGQPLSNLKSHAGVFRRFSKNFAADPVPFYDFSLRIGIFS